MTTTEPTAIQRAVQIMGSQLALSKALGVTPVTVNQWVRPKDVNSHRPVPPKQCVRIEVLTSGQVSRRELRPNDWIEIWPELAEKFQQPQQAA